jgi:intracellular septation protein A
MNSSLIWFGFLPVMAFLLMSSFGGKRQALWGALVMGALEAGYSIAVVGALDYMSLLAFTILGVFVAASLRNEDDFFFKISGAVINAIQAVVMLVAFYGFHHAMLLDAAHKYLDLDKLVAANPQLNKEIITETFRLLSYQLPAWLILHALLTVYAAANWSKWAWAFVNVPGLIIVLALAFAFAEVGVLKESPEGFPTRVEGTRDGKGTPKPAAELKPSAEPAPAVKAP